MKQVQILSTIIKRCCSTSNIKVISSSKNSSVIDCVNGTNTTTSRNCTDNISSTTTVNTIICNTNINNSNIPSSRISDGTHNLTNNNLGSDACANNCYINSNRNTSTNIRNLNIKATSENSITNINAINQFSQLQLRFFTQSSNRFSQDLHNKSSLYKESLPSHNESLPLQKESTSQNNSASLDSTSSSVGSKPVDRRPRFAFWLDQRLEAALQADKSGFTGVKSSKLKNQPGKRSLPHVSLPRQLVEAIDLLLEDETMVALEKEAVELVGYLINRQLPLEDVARKQKMDELLKIVIQKESVDPHHPAILEKDREKLLRYRRAALAKQVQSKIYNWKPVDFSTRHSCLVYLVGRMRPDYAALVRVFNELKFALPRFRPTTLMDFGSGVGSSIWAMDAVWPSGCKETFSVDSSGEMNLLAESLLRGGNTEDDLIRRRHTTFFRQFLPASASIKHDLVVASRTLFELESRAIRLRTLDILWKTVAPGGCFVLVEYGTVKGCELMLEARHFLLEAVDVGRSSFSGKIIAPCQHQYTCPLLKKNEKHRKCATSVRYFPVDHNDDITRSEVFSYLIVQKVRSSDAQEVESSSWPRIVEPVLKRGGHSIVRVCNKYGNLQELAVSKSKHGALCYRISRTCRLGDIFPVELLPPEETVKPTVSKYKLKKEQAKRKYVEKIADSISSSELPDDLHTDEDANHSYCDTLSADQDEKFECDPNKKNL